MRQVLRRRIGLSGNELGKAIFDGVSHFVQDSYLRFGATTVTVGADRKLMSYVVVTRVDDELLGPHDAVRLVVEEYGRYTFIVYDRSLQEGTLRFPVASMSVIDKMNDRNWVACPGINNYSTLKTKLGMV